MKIKISEIVVLIVLIPHLINGFYNQQLIEVSLPIYYLIRLISTLFIPLIGIIILSKKCSYNRTDFGLVISNKLKSIWGILLATFMVALFWYFFPIFYYQRLEHLLIKLFPTDFLKMPFQVTASKYSILLSIFLAISAGFFEEIYYRSILFKILKDRKMNTVLIILLSSLIFTSAHWESGIHYLPLVFMTTVFLMWFYAKFRTVIPLIAVHIIVDLLSIFQK
jgi:membrane protease YdiL (CAAX protease family)